MVSEKEEDGKMNPGYRSPVRLGFPGSSPLDIRLVLKRKNREILAYLWRDDLGKWGNRLSMEFFWGG